MNEDETAGAKINFLLIFQGMYFRINISEYSDRKQIKNSEWEHLYEGFVSA